MYLCVMEELNTNAHTLKCEATQASNPIGVTSKTLVSSVGGEWPSVSLEHTENSQFVTLSYRGNKAILRTQDLNSEEFIQNLLFNPDWCSTEGSYRNDLEIKINIVIKKFLNNEQ